MAAERLCVRTHRLAASTTSSRSSASSTDSLAALTTSFFTRFISLSHHTRPHTREKTTGQEN